LKPFLWPRTIADARAAQELLRHDVKIVPLKKKPRFVAGVDAAFAGDWIIGVVCVYDYRSLTRIDESCTTMRSQFPYVPGFLSFREGPVIMDAVRRLSVRPCVFLFDGQGIAHPRGFGLASHIGVLLDTPSIGCAKSRLVGTYKEPAGKRGSWSPLIFHDDVVGAVLRTKDNVRPLFISPGHRVDLEGAVNVVLHGTTRYRIPEPLRRADYVSKKIKREMMLRRRARRNEQGRIRPIGLGPAASFEPRLPVED